MWSEKNSIALSKVSVRIFLALLVAVDISGYWLVSWFVQFSRYQPIWQKPYPTLMLISLYAASIPAYCILFCLDRLLKNIEGGEIFIPQNVSALRSASWCCIVVAAICLASCIFYIPFIAVAVAAAFMALIIRIIKNVFEQAIAMKADLDLTI